MPGEDDNSWFPDLGVLNPLVMPTDGLRYTRSMEGNGAAQVKAGMEWVSDQGQNALPDPPFRGFVLKVEKGNDSSWMPNSWLPGVFSNNDPKSVICYIPMMHAFVPKWKSNSVKDLEENERIKFNKKILDMIAQNGGRFVIHVDSPEMEGIQITPGDELLLDYQDKKKFTGGYVAKVLKNNKANWLPPEWQNPIGNAAAPASAKSAVDKGSPSPISDLTPSSGVAFLDVPPAEFDNEQLDPDIPANYRPFLHPLNGIGVIASAAPLRNTKTGTHAGVDIGPNGTPIYAVADGYVSSARQPSGKKTKKYVSDRHLRYLTEETFTETAGENSGRKYVLRDSSMSAMAGWFCEIIHWGSQVKKHPVNGQGWGANNQNGYGSRYLHMLSPPLVKRGEKVKKGQLLGYVGGTPFFAPHLHFEVVYKGLYADPTPYMYMDINAIAMIEYGGLGADKQSSGSDFGYVRKYADFGGKTKGYNFRIGKFITGQQLVWPKDGAVNPNNPKSSRQWYKPISGNPLSTEDMTYTAQQMTNPNPTENTDGKDTANEKTPGIGDLPSQPKPS
jgi:murein DD-endopeptidase MepM/ murein hydrolase activator NlpD